MHNIHLHRSLLPSANNPIPPGHISARPAASASPFPTAPRTLQACAVVVSSPLLVPARPPMCRCRHDASPPGGCSQERLFALAAPGAGWCLAGAGRSDHADHRLDRERPDGGVCWVFVTCSWPVLADMDGVFQVSAASFCCQICLYGGRITG